ncbi:MAG: hypothetical protein ACK4S0_06985 [Sediminibacterium sp.]
MTAIKNDTLRIYDELKSVDLTMVKERLVKQEGYNSCKVDEMVNEYRKYISMIISRRHRGEKRGMPICEEVDPVWHTHILFTQDYIRMCKQFAGFYIHHQPMEVNEELISDYHEITLVEYENNFGKRHEFWGTGKQVCRGVDGEGNCSNQCGEKFNPADVFSDTFFLQEA